MKAWHSLRLAEHLAAAILALLGLAVLIGVGQMRVGAAAAFQPKLFPLLVGWLLIAAGAGLAGAAWRTPAHQTVEWPARVGATRMAVFLASVAAYLMSIDLIGMPLATFVVVSFEVWYLGNYRWHIPLVVGLLSAAILYFGFMQALGLTLPTGPFEQ